MTQIEAKLLVALMRLADASEDFAGSDPDMASHYGSEMAFEKALADAREVITEVRPLREP